MTELFLLLLIIIKMIFHLTGSKYFYKMNSVLFFATKGLYWVICKYQIQLHFTFLSNRGRQDEFQSSAWYHETKHF